MTRTTLFRPAPVGKREQGHGRAKGEPAGQAAARQSNADLISKDLQLCWRAQV